MRLRKPPPRTYSKQTFLFMAISIFLMVVVHYLFLGTFDSSEQDMSVQANAAQSVVGMEPQAGGKTIKFLKPARVRERHNYPLFAEYYPGEQEVLALEKALKPSHSYALKNTGADKARIAIVIDDVGMNRKQSRAVVEMDDVPLTLAFLPYAPDLKALTKPAQNAGHELIIHMPMEPMNGDIDTGPIALKSGMDAEAITEMMDQAFESFDGYVGINNHMGSKLTQDVGAMRQVMDILDKRGLFYLDSKTISTSIAAKAAQEQGILFAERDVFLDHKDNLKFVRSALKRTEEVALEKGYAIAIGHPKANTVEGLKEWIPTLEARGFEVVPVSELLKEPKVGGVVMAKAKTAKPKKLKKKRFLKKEPKLKDIEPAAGDDVASEDLLSAPIGVARELTDGLYSLSE